MKRMLGSRTSVLILGTVAVLIVVYLAAGLSSLRFEPAHSYTVEQVTQRVPYALEEHPESIDWRTILIWSALILSALVLIYAILDPEQRKKLLRILLRMTLLAVMMVFVFSKYGGQELLTGREGEQAGNGPFSQNLTDGQAQAPPPFIPPRLPAWALYLVTLATVLAVAGLAWLIAWWNRRRLSTAPLGELAKIAGSTLEDIRAGEDWEDAVIQCYIRMSETVNARRGLARQAAMTPTEFAVQLEAFGLPGDAVRRLTTLFERARYGAKKSTQRDISEAVDCLTIILHACREAL